MSELLTATQSNLQTSYQLQIRHGDGVQTRHVIAEGESLIAGRGDQCSLRLIGGDVAELHCWLRVQDGQLSVQDWYSAVGTVVDGNPISAETIVAVGSEIRVGEVSIVVETGNGAACRETDERQRPPDPTLSAQEDVDTDPTPPAGSPDGGESVHMQLLAAWEEIESLRGQLNRLSAGTQDPQDPAEGFVPTPLCASVDDETVQLLREEIEHLQAELAERDAQVCEFGAFSSQTAAADDEERLSAEESAALVGRLEQLLEELGQSDERVAALEEMLQLSDESRQADQEELRQIESWLSEIEQRVTQRDAERDAEINVLRTQLHEHVDQRRQLEQQLIRGGSNPEQTSAQLEMLKRLQQQCDLLQQQLQESEQQRLRLESELQSRGTAEGDAAEPEAGGLTLREERLQLAQERAELARQRAELTRLRTELEKEGQLEETIPQEGDERVRALRQHLKEIHSKEEDARRERRLSSRLARLWKQLDGR